MYFPPVNQFYISGYVFVSWYILREKIMWYMYKCCGQTNLRKMSSLYWTSLAPCSRSREVRGLSVPPWTNKRAVINGPCCSPRPSPEFIKLPSGVDRDQLLKTLSHSQTSVLNVFCTTNGWIRATAFWIYTTIKKLRL